MLVMLGMLDNGGGDSLLEKAPTKDEIHFERAILVSLWFEGKAFCDGHVVMGAGSGGKYVVAILARGFGRAHRFFTRRAEPTLVLGFGRGRGRGSVIITPSSPSSTGTSPTAGRPPTSPSSATSPARCRKRVLVLVLVLVLRILKVRPGILEISTEVLGILASRPAAASTSVIIVGLGRGTERLTAAAVSTLTVVF